MLAIRMQRLGRKGHPTYRVVVQDSRQTPTSGKVVAMLGSYDPHTKQTTLVKEKSQLFLDNGAQPSERVVKLLVNEGIKLPKWVKEPTRQSRDIRNLEKLRKNRPAEPQPKEQSEVQSGTELTEAVPGAVGSTDNSSATEPEEAATVEAPVSEAPAETAAEVISETKATAIESGDGEEPEEPDETPTPGSDEFPEDKVEAEKTAVKPKPSKGNSEKLEETSEVQSHAEASNAEASATESREKA